MSRFAVSVCLATLVAFAALQFAWQRIGQRVPSPPQPNAQSSAALEHPARAGWMSLDTHGCWMPRAQSVSTLELERSSLQKWRETSSADRLVEDACGNVWALWFNSWVVFVDGDPNRIGHLALPASSDVLGIKNSGVAAFLPMAGEFWVLGNTGTLARYDGSGWQRMPVPDDCRNGQLVRFEQAVWLSCPKPIGGFVGRWHAEQGIWLDEHDTLPMINRMLATSDGRLLVAGAGALAVWEPGPEAQWRTLARPGDAVVALAADAARIAVATHKGLQVFDRQGTAMADALADADISGIAVLADVGVFAAIRNHGLRYFDGDRWSAWRYAQGLPDDDGRDLLLDSRQRLWLAGTPTAVIDAAAAAVQIGQLKEVLPLDGQHFSDACAAASALLSRAAGSGQVSQEFSHEGHKVFFSGQQVCPAPWRQSPEAAQFWRRDSDGALLEVAYNGHRGMRDCRHGCADPRALAPYWRIRIHQPAGPSARSALIARTLPLPEPLPAETPGTHLLLTRSGEVWVDTRSTGVYRYDGTRWHHHFADAGLSADSAIGGLIEDLYGAVWIAARPDRRAGAGTAGAAALHRWVAQSWQHVPLGTAYASWSIGALHAVPGGVIAGGNGGLLDVSSQGTVVAAAAKPIPFVTDVSVDRGHYRWMAHATWAPGFSIADQARVGRLTSRQGLFDDRIVRVATDEDARVWLVSVDGKVAVHSRFLLMEKAAW